ncbi:M48 family metalloprotease [Streptomyces sp. NPDC004610]|uniref:M48 family metalloprotease n=1 Tax=unclassified Streptomyces TaxID=2593676 RepID=UPI0033A50C1C
MRIEREDQRALGQGTTRRCALFLVLVVTLALGLPLHLAQGLGAAPPRPQPRYGPPTESMIGHPLDTADPGTAARAYDPADLDAAVPFALWGCGLTLALATALFLCGPRWRLRGGRLDEIGAGAGAGAGAGQGPEALLLHEALRLLVRRSGVVPSPVFLRDPRRLTTGAVTLGGAGRYAVVLDNGLCALRAGGGDGARVFDAVVLHELAHIRNRDVELGLALRALWQAFCLVVVLPGTGFLTWLCLRDVTGAAAVPRMSPWPTALALAGLTALTYAAYTEFLRSRELCADLDAVDWGADPEAWGVLAVSAMGPGWDRAAWDAGPRSFRELPGWLRTARPLRAATRPWHTHPGWWRRHRALKRPSRLTGSPGTVLQALLLTGVIVVLLTVLLTLLAPASRLGPLPGLLFAAGVVLCGSLGRDLTTHPNAPFRPRPRTFGTGARGGTRRAAVLGVCGLLLFLLDPLGRLLSDV